MTSTLQADLAVTGGRVVSVLTGEVFPAELAIRGDTIAGVLPPGSPIDAGTRIDAAGQVIAPGFIDSHMHIESSFLTPGAFADLTLARGTTTVLADPHEIVNVTGAAGLRWLVEAGRRTPQTMLFGVPSCVPSLPGLETAGADLGSDEIAELLQLPGVAGLGEVMDYRAVVAGDARMAAIVETARRAGMIIDGHCPGLSGAELSTYLAAGIDSDHTKNAVAVSIEKARLGMHVQVQEKSISSELMAGLMALPLRPPFSLVTDDVATDALVERGHLDHLARRAVAAGLPPLEALRAITWTPAQRLRLHDRGSVTPGRRADVVLLQDLASFRPSVVVAGGRIVAREGRSLDPAPAAAGAGPFRDSVRLTPPDADAFAWHPGLPDGVHRCRAIRMNPDDTSTAEAAVDVTVRDGRVVLPPGVALLAIFHRHGRTADRAFAPLVGLELAAGAAATTYAHDSHNLLVLGTSPDAMAAAAGAVVRAGGGVAVARGTQTVALLPLPIAGLMSDAPAAQVASAAGAVRGALHDWGYRHANAFMSLATLSLPVSPHLKLTDRGLVDVTSREMVDAWLPSPPSVAAEGGPR